MTRSRQLQDYVARITFLGWHIFAREFKVRYRRAFLGFFWAVTSVLAVGASIIYVGEDLGLGNVPHGIPYPAYVLTSLIIWQCFSQGLSVPQQIAKRSRTFMRRTPFERESILVACALFMAVDFCLRLPVLVGVFIYYGILPPLTLIPAFLVGIPAMAAAGLALGALTVPISLVSTDIRYSLPFFQAVLLVITPVFYGMPESGLFHWLNVLNPLTYVLSTTRDWMLVGTGSGIICLLLTVASWGFFVIAMAYYRRFLDIGVAHI